MSVRRSVLAALLLAGCGPKPAAEAPTPAATTAPSVMPVAPSASASAPPSEEWRCGGELVPPTGWQQDTAFVEASTPDARERAGELASRKLEQRLCGGGAGCAALRARITTWKTGSNGKEVCAMAVVKAADLEAFRADALSLGKLDAEIAKAVEELLPKAVRGKRITIDRIIDAGIPGGARADWLRARLEQKIAGNANLVTAPRGWAGDGVPKGVDVAIRAELVSRREGQIGVVEANLRALGEGAKILGGARVTFPESAAPPPGSAVAPPPEETRGLSVHIDAHQGGSLCAGEKTQIWLKSESHAVARVINLYGTSEALLVWPDEDNPKGEIKGGVSVALGGKEGFEAVPVPGSEAERFLVIAAPTAAGLGPFANVKGTCRIPSAIARELHQSKGLPAGAKVATDGYRLVSGPECGAPLPEEKRRAAAAAIAGLPECQMR